MTREDRNAWKMTTIGIGLLVGVVVVTGVVMASWTEREGTPQATWPISPPRPAALLPVAAPRHSPVPSQVAIDGCHQQATAQTSQTGTTMEVVKDGAIVNENGKNDERYRDAYASCMQSRGYTG